MVRFYRHETQLVFRARPGPLPGWPPVFVSYRRMRMRYSGMLCNCPRKRKGQGGFQGFYGIARREFMRYPKNGFIAINKINDDCPRLRDHRYVE
jgi:hypothetical protein